MCFVAAVSLFTFGIFDNSHPIQLFTVNQKNKKYIFIWLKRWLPFSGLYWRMIPKNSMMRERLLLDTTHLSGAATLIVPVQCDQGRRKESTQQWLGPCCCTPSAAQETEAISFWHQILWLDWWYLLCGYPAGVVSGPLGPCGITTVTTQGG